MPESNSKKQLAEDLFRDDIKDISTYQSARRIGGEGNIWINANESPFSNFATNTIDLNGINRYPEPQPQQLIEAYAAYANVEADQLLCCRGADEAIELLIRSFCQPSIDSISYFGPSYGMYNISAQANAVQANEIAFNNDFTLPENISLAKTSKLIFVCNPNNPTGTVIEIDEIESLLNKLPNSLVVIDEAYIEFASAYSSIRLLDRYPNLVILRTLSKAFALAGARCGFLIASENIVQQVNRIIAPYPIPTPIEQIAIQSLSKSGIEIMQSQVAQLLALKTELTNVLIVSGAKVLNSYTNFIFAEFSDPDDIWTRLANKGINARRYQSKNLLNAIRFSIGNSQEIESVIKIFEGIKG
ncbi:histidinol-phosphate transaminase [Parashewanella spongiae]|uniref:Histidinol-phosphate aminotransferase n=1 Tax=Parashewanella spongiae TaxID=342950 RepID=A0A3A6UJA0_9GAMM|nr:histidinol-phosphate transaminase [Parashewanella spongiae]MCL1076826.1 histidinol-phosphate transaminase [Parashewanella spongiae]RJY19194.1 histidinol-phosphate transaminase [Parashewanella spongiae]